MGYFRSVLLFTIYLIICRHGKVECSGKQIALSPRIQFFDIDLLAKIAEEKPGNIMVSPASVKSTLFMLLEGSQGETSNELRKALRLSPDREEMREQLSLYMSAFQTNHTGVELEHGNGVFVSDKLKFKKPFEEAMQNIYDAELSSVNFSKPTEAAELVNGWVMNKTHDLLSELVEPSSISPTSSLLILNVLYFKANWKHAFNPQYTRTKNFFKDSAILNATTMHLHHHLKYAYIEDLRAHAVELPYEGDRFSALVLVPQDRDGCGTVVRDLPHVSLDRVVTLLQLTDVQLSLPRFTVDFTDDLIVPLKQIKINRLFSSSAEMSGMLEGDSRGVRVDSVIHRVHTKVSELGTEAAAATGAVVVPLMGSNTVRLAVDRPFLFFIRDNISGALLFEGKIEDPELVTSHESAKI